MNRELKKKRQYMSPHCWIISMDDEGFICVSGKLDASGSSGGYWETGGFIMVITQSGLVLCPK